MNKTNRRAKVHRLHHFPLFRRHVPTHQLTTQRPLQPLINHLPPHPSPLSATSDVHLFWHETSFFSSPPHPPAPTKHTAHIATHQRPPSAPILPTRHNFEELSNMSHHPISSSKKPKSKVSPQPPNFPERAKYPVFLSAMCHLSLFKTSRTNESLQCATQ